MLEIFLFVIYPGTYLRKNTVLRELWLAHNDLTAEDAYSIGNVLRSNFFLQFLDLSNNNIQVKVTRSVRAASSKI